MGVIVMSDKELTKAKKRIKQLEDSIKGVVNEKKYLCYCEISRIRENRPCAICRFIDVLTYRLKDKESK